MVSRLAALVRRYKVFSLSVFCRLLVYPILSGCYRCFRPSCLFFLQEYQTQKNAACAAATSDAASVGVSCPANVVKIFEEGLVVEVVQYKSGYDRDIHIIYESDRHESDVNRFRPHSIVLGSVILFGNATSVHLLM